MRGCGGKFFGKTSARFSAGRSRVGLWTGSGSCSTTSTHAGSQFQMGSSSPTTEHRQTGSGVTSGALNFIGEPFVRSKKVVAYIRYSTLCMQQGLQSLGEKGSKITFSTFTRIIGFCLHLEFGKLANSTRSIDFLVILDMNFTVKFRLGLKCLKFHYILLYLCLAKSQACVRQIRQNPTCKASSRPYLYSRKMLI